MEVIPNAVEMKQSECEKKRKCCEEIFLRKTEETLSSDSVLFQGLAQTRKLLTENIHLINPSFSTYNNEVWVQAEK